jgi:hypothetical protein
MFAFPRDRPKTIRGLEKWHCGLLEVCVDMEFEKRALEAGIDRINGEIQKYVAWSKEEGPSNPALLALVRLNRLKAKWKENLAFAKEIIRVAHDTNEMIVGIVLRGCRGESIIRHFEEQKVPLSANLLHEPGWLFELQIADHLRKQGYAAFVTFGTIFDAKGFDVLAVPRPRRRIKWRGAWPPGKGRRDVRIGRGEILEGQDVPASNGS